MARRKFYQVYAVCTYKGQEPKRYLEFESRYKREVNNWMKTRAYQTPTRSYILEEAYSSSKVNKVMVDNANKSYPYFIKYPCTYTHI